MEPEDEEQEEPLIPVRQTRRQILRACGIGLAATFIGGGAAIFETRNLQLVSREIRLPQWDADGFRVAIISDIHANNPFAADIARRAVHMAIREKPDLILLPGDFVNSSTASVIRTMTGALEELHEAGCPVLGVLGNHDYWSGAPSDILEALKQKTPVKMLVNEGFEWEGVTVVGLDDAISGEPRQSVVADSHNRSLLVMLHEPDFVKETPKNASLQVSGHSHGGQCCLPGGTPIHLPRGAHKYAKGLYIDAPIPLYVTRGVGTVGPKIRTFCPPEVSLLTLRGPA